MHWFQPIMISKPNIECRHNDAKYGQEEEKHWNSSTSDTWIDNLSQHSNGRLAPSWGTHCFHEETGSRYPEAITTKVHQAARRNGDKGRIDTKFSLDHVVILIIHITVNSCHKSHEESAYQSSDCIHVVEVWLIFRVQSEELRSEKSNSNTLLCSESSSYNDPITSFVVE